MTTEVDQFKGDPTAEALRLISDFAFACHDDDATIYEFCCGNWLTLARLAARLSVAGKAGRLVGIAVDDSDLSEAESHLRPWLSEHEISLLSHVPESLSNASSVIVNETAARLPDHVRLEAFTTAKGALGAGGALLYVGRLAHDIAPVLIPGGQATFVEAAAIRDLYDVGFARIEPLMRWRDLVLVAAFAD